VCFGRRKEHGSITGFIWRAMDDGARVDGRGSIDRREAGTEI
jgi:hypothetical protein